MCLSSSLTVILNKIGAILLYLAFKIEPLQHTGLSLGRLGPKRSVAKGIGPASDLTAALPLATVRCP